MLNKYTDLEKCPLFKGLKIDTIVLQMSNIHYQVKSYEKGQMIVFSGVQADRLLIVLKGCVKGEMVDYSGKTIKIEDIQAPMPLAIAFLFGKENIFPVSVVANEKTELLVIPKPSLLMLFRNNEEILVNFLDSVSNRSQFLSGKIKFLTFQTIKGKIANYILQSRKKDQFEIVLDKSQSELAELFGVTRPSVGRGIRELHDEKVIDAKGKKLKILNIDKLKDYLK